METNNFVKLANAQQLQGTLYCAGLDLHSFGKIGQSPQQNLRVNLEIYKALIKSEHDSTNFKISQEYYSDLADKLPGITNPMIMGELMAALNSYLLKRVDFLIEQCNIRVFKPQAAFYEQFGPLGLVLLSQLCWHLKKWENSLNTLIINLLDCKRGDISTTQAAYFTALLCNLMDSWGVDYAPYDFDIINVTPWMGSDVMVFESEDKTPGLGLQLMRSGKGIIVVNKSSNPSSPEYQELKTERAGLTLQMCNVHDLYNFSQKYELEAQGLSTIGMVVGSTHICDGSIRRAFPGSTLLVPGFGAQGGKFNFIMPELIQSGPWEGQGALFGSSRGTMYAHLSSLGGSGNIRNIDKDLKTATSNFRINERKAYSEANIRYPF